VLRAAEELGYRRNTHAAQLASRRAMILGLGGH
jgi:DNA-binding LacI/PurR family transcriptional regulator